jgi:acetyltransferase-like isoleucine patch superfamily enzyme
MLKHRYAWLALRWAWLRLRWRGRLRTDGLCFVGPGVKLEIGRDAVLHLGRWCWIGHGTKIRAHEGVVRIGAKSVLGQECTISAFQHVSSRPRVRHRRPRDADRLRPRRRRGRAPDPPAGDLQARRAGRAQRAGSATAPASCAASRSATIP